MSRGSLTDSRNPSSALCGRIRDATKGGGKGADAGFFFGGSFNGGGKGAGGWLQPGPIAQSRQASAEDVEQFIAASLLDERAAGALRSSSPEVQQVVMDRGDLSQCSNASSAVQGRIRDALNAMVGGGKGGGGYGPVGAKPVMAPVKPGELQYFINVNNIDERAATALQSSTNQIQRYVLERGSLVEMQNPSSAVLGRIKDAQRAASAGGQGKGGNGDWMAMAPLTAGKGKGTTANQADMSFAQHAARSFLTMNNIDQRASEAFLACGAEVQQAVITRGGLQDARNPSSALLGRIKDAQAELPSVKQEQGPQTGDWGGMRSSPPVEEFIMVNNLDDRAAQALLSQTEDVQNSVVERGSLQDARNPSSAVLGRIRDATGGGKGGRFSPY
jgi:hypothetical protein